MTPGDLEACRSNAEVCVHVQQLNQLRRSPAAVHGRRDEPENRGKTRLNSYTQNTTTAMEELFCRFYESFLL